MYCKGLILGFDYIGDLFISIMINLLVLIPVKIIARGFFVDQMSYVRDPWNLVDLFVVGLGYIMQIIDLVSPYIMKATQESLLKTTKILSIIQLNDTNHNWCIDAV